MSWNVKEWSIFGGRPVELFRFAYGATRLLFTSSDEAVTYNNEVYLPTTIDRTKLGIAYDITKADITVTVPRDNALAQLFIGPPPDDVVSLTIYGYHKGDDEFVVLWQGRVTGATFIDSEANITCEPIFTALRRPGLRAMYQTSCRHELYGTACGVNPAVFQVDTAVASVSSTTLVITTTKPDGWATGGLLTTAAGAKRWILQQTGTTLLLNNYIPGLAQGHAVRIYAGCNQSLAECTNKFNNGANFGGFPFIPTKNPFAGDAIM